MLLNVQGSTDGIATAREKHNLTHREVAGPALVKKATDLKPRHSVKGPILWTHWEGGTTRFYQRARPIGPARRNQRA